MKRALIIVLAIVDFLAISLVAYWLFWPFATLTQTGPITVDGSPTPGEAIVYHFPYCKQTSVDSDSFKEIVSTTGLVNALPHQTGSLPMGCGTAVGRSVVIPTDLPPGRYHIDFTTSYQVNSLRKITDHFHSDEFTVQPAKTQQVSLESPEPVHTPPVTPEVITITPTPSAAPAGSTSANQSSSTTTPPANHGIVHQLVNPIVNLIEAL